MKLKIPLFFTFIFLLFTFASPAFAQSATLSLDPASGTFNKGCPVAVKINLSTGGADTDGTDAILAYDSSRFTAQNIVNGMVYPDYPGNYIDNAAGKITISGLASVTTPFNGQGVLATINFTVVDTAVEGATQLTLEFDPQSKGETRDSNVVQRGTAVDVLNSVTNANYIVGTGACAGVTTVVSPGTGGMQTATSAATIDQVVDQTGKGPGTPEITSTLAIMGIILTVLGILGLALL